MKELRERNKSREAAFKQIFPTPHYGDIYIVSPFYFKHKATLVLMEVLHEATFNNNIVSYFNISDSDLQLKQQ